MNISGSLIFLILALATLPSYSQDTLVFQKTNNENKIIKMPLNEYDIIIKPKHGKRKRVIITDYNDSSLTMKVWAFKGKGRKEKRKQLREMYRNYPLMEGMPIDTIKRRLAIRDSLREQILFSGQENIHVSKLDKLIIRNAHRPEMHTILKTTEWTALGWLLVGIPGIAIFQSLAYYAAWNVVGIGVITLAIIIENKTLKMSKWKIE